MTVHFPITFYILGVVLTLFYLWRGHSEVEHFAYWSFMFSGIAAIIASLVGLIDQNQLELNDPRRITVNNHITAGVILMIINSLLVYMRFRWPDVLIRYRWPYLALMALGLAAVWLTAWLGAELVYRLHVGLIQ